MLYLPSASVLMSDGFFAKRPQEAKYDTIISAKEILRSVNGIYGGDDSSPLNELHCTLPSHPKLKSGSTLQELCKTGLATNEPVISRSEDPAFGCNLGVSM